jgi:hypothetical protein
MIVVDDCALDLERVRVAVTVDGTAAAPAGRMRRGRVGPVADRVVVGHDAVEHYPRDSDAAERGSVGAPPALEGVAGDVHRLVVPLGEGADCGAAEIRPDVVTAVVDEPGVDDL